LSRFFSREGQLNDQSTIDALFKKIALGIAEPTSTMEGEKKVWGRDPLDSLEGKKWGEVQNLPKEARGGLCEWLENDAGTMSEKARIGQNHKWNLIESKSRGEKEEF